MDMQRRRETPTTLARRLIACSKSNRYILFGWAENQEEVIVVQSVGDAETRRNSLPHFAGDYLDAGGVLLLREFPRRVELRKA